MTITTSLTTNLGLTVVDNPTGLGGQALTNNFNAIDAAGFLGTFNSNKYKIISAIIFKNTSNEWTIMGHPLHDPINVTSVETKIQKEHINYVSTLILKQQELLLGLVHQMNLSLQEVSILEHQ